MAYLGYSDDFDLDDDGILRDSAEHDGILIDDDGIVRDDFDVFSKQTSSTHWTDSGLGGDKQSSTPSTLRQLDLQSYPSFDDVSHQFDESHVNISDLEASKDDLSFDDYNNDRGYGDRADNSSNHKGGNRSGLSSRSSFDHSLNFEDNFDTNKSDAGSSHQELFGDDYFRQLQELGVLVDETEFENHKSSLQEFESFEDEYSRDYEDRNGNNAIDQFFQRDSNRQVRDSTEIEGPDNLEQQSNIRPYLDDSRDFVVPDVYNDTQDLDENEKSRTRPNTASSTRTISSRSFPEISPEEALELYTDHQALIDNDAESIDFEESQKTVEQVERQDDEIYFENSSQNSATEQPRPAKMPAFDNENVPSVTPRSDRSMSQDSDSGHSRSESGASTPQADETTEKIEEKMDSLTQVTGLDSRQRTQSESYRPDSQASQRSAASDRPVVRPKIRKPTAQKTPQTLPKARSQESFFETDDKRSSRKGPEKGPKRLLPKPIAGDENQSFKIKSKSTTNISAHGPVKPTHMSLAELQHINLDDADFDLHDQSETKSTASEVPKGELTKKLKQESSKRQQATELVKQLQTDYDKLLSKYALAELTIDQLRLGAKISLYANSPTPSQATSGSLQSGQQPQMLHLSLAQRGAVSASPFQAVNNVFFPESQGGDGVDSRLPQHGGPSPQLPLARSNSTTSMDSTSTPRGEVEQPGNIADGAEKVKLSLLFQTRNLDQRMEQFQTLLDSNQVPMEDQEKVFDQIRINHEQLRRDYLQSKEDYNVLRRSTAAGSDANFDQEKELEGELFKLGMKFDEIHEKVDENMKEQAAKRQPFQSQHQGEGNLSDTDSLQNDPAMENTKRKMTGTKAGDDLVHPKSDSQFDKKLNHLHEEYNALMDRYRRLKQMAQSPDRDKEIDNLVKKLRNICHEEPDVFRLPTDLQERWEKLKRKDRKQGDVSLNQSRGTDNLSHRSDSPGGARARRPSHNTSLDSIRSSPDQNGYRGSKSVGGGGLRRDVIENDLRDSGHRTGSYSSLSSRGRPSPSPRDSSFHDRNSPVSSLPRPHRHDHPDLDRRDRRGLKKADETGSSNSLAADSGIFSVIGQTVQRPEGGSMSSLPDSGISEHEGASGATSHALSKLPGPGKFKQMTGRREQDTDSGFIGSMVGSEVSAGNLSSRRPPQMSPLRVRHPGDDGKNQRPSSRQSSASSARAGSPSSVTSSRSARRTPRATPPHTPTRTPTRTPTGTPNRTPTGTPNHLERQDPVRLRPSSQNQSGQTSRTDFTDDSYTTVTESEMSFESSDLRPRRSKPPSSHNTSRVIEKIDEDSEEEQYTVDPTLNETTDLNLSWITSDSDGTSTRHSRRSNLSIKGAKTKPVTATPSKPQGVKQRQVEADTDRTPTASPTRDTTETTYYTSDDTTPRSVIERERKQASRRPPIAIVKEPEVHRPTSPGLVRESAQQIAAVKRPGLQYQQVQARDRRSQELPPSLQSQTKPLHREMTSVGVGSGSDETILASDADTAATRDSVNSQRLKMLSEEIGKLRDEFQRSHQDQQRKIQQQNQMQAQIPVPQPQPQPQQPAQPHDPYYDQYFDPTEDPLAFMRGPRRRANSFSGRGGIDYDYDWSLPKGHRDNDIPLGYAAADSYADPRSRTEEKVRSRGRRRLEQRIKQRNAGSQYHVEQNGYESDQSPTRQPVAADDPAVQRLQGHFGYYTPRSLQQASSPEQQAQTPRINAPLQAGRRVYGSQPNLTFAGYQPPPPPPPRSARSVASSGSTPRVTTATPQGHPPQGHPLRQGLYYTATGNQPRQGRTEYAHDDIYVNDGQRTFIPSGAIDVGSETAATPGEYGAVYTSTCPLCGSSSSHTHGEYVYPPPDNRPLGYLIQSPAGDRPSRSRSKSATRMRHYSPDSKVRSRYFVREFGSDSESAESDVEVDYRPSRATDRQRRMKHGRKYRRSRGAMYNSQPGGLHLSSPRDTGEVTLQADSATTRKDNREFAVNQEANLTDSDSAYTDTSISTKETNKPKSEKPTASTANTTADKQVVKTAENPQGLVMSSAAEADLNASLHLVDEIDLLTRKMMSTVGSELARSKRKEFGSSIW